MDIDNNYISTTFIDVKLIYDAISHYITNDYSMISVPSCVNIESTLHSISEEKIPYINPIARDRKHNSYYVGSAEQSFIYLHSIGKIDNGKYMALTPCVRDEIEDEFHLSVFLKLELIIIGIHNIPDIMNSAISFFKQFNNDVVVVDSGNRPFEKDLLINGIEVGSYGIDYMLDGTPYTYGTGIAEPRFSYSLI